MPAKSWILLVLFVGVQQTTPQQLPPGYVDPRPVLQAAARAIGTDNLRCVTLSGTGYAGMVGQQRLNDKGVDWPRGEPLANYSRTMNWETRTMKEEFDRKPGLNPASWKYGVGWMDGTPVQQNSPSDIHGQRELWLAYRWSGQRSPVAARPEDAEIWQLDMWLNPHGFLKAAMMPGANPKAVWRWELGEMGRDGPTTTPERSRWSRSPLVESTGWMPRSTKKTCCSDYIRGFPIPSSAT